MVICGRCGEENDAGVARCAACDAPLPRAASGTMPPPTRSTPVVGGVLAEPTQRVAAGQEAVFTLLVRNGGATPDRLTIEVMGEPGAWATLDPPSLELPPGASAAVVVRLRPPASAGDPTRSVDFGLAVRSSAHPEAAAIELGVLEIRPASEATTEPGAVAGPGTAAGRRPGAPMLAAVAAVVLVVLAAGVILVGSSAFGPGSSPAAGATSSPGASSSPAATSSPLAASSPSATPAPEATLQPVTPSGAPGGPVAWWQDAYDAATARGIALGAVIGEGTTAESLPYAEFANGSIVQRVYDAYWLSDGIWSAWKALGGGPGPASNLGYPATFLLGPSLAERRQLFDDGAIYWTPATGAHDVFGAVWAWWRTLVGQQGGDVGQPGESGLVDPLGQPTSDVRTDATGSWVELENGMLGVSAGGEGWACAYAGPVGGFPSCAELGRAPSTLAP